MRDLFLGADAGGTKTHVAVMDGAGQVLALGIASTGNWERVGLSGTVTALARAIDDALDRVGATRAEVTAASFALAGIDWPSDAATMEHVLAGFGLACTPVVMNDALAVLLAGLPDGIGCASVAGTGGKTVARDGLRTLTTLGMGLGEGGGAGQVVDETMQAVAQAYHGQRPSTALTAAVLDATGQPDLATMFEAVARSGLQLEESFAPAVFGLAEQGDAMAVDVVQRVARQHARDVVGLADQLTFAGAIVPVVCAGGLHTAGSQVFAEAFDVGLRASRWLLQARVLDAVPVTGALVDAASRTQGPLAAPMRQALIAGTTDLLQAAVAAGRAV